nr:MAG TPA: hypothetical protein [Caudoviricetes sp.]
MLCAFCCLIRPLTAFYCVLSYRGCYKNNPCTYGESSNICKSYFCYSFF